MKKLCKPNRYGILLSKILMARVSVNTNPGLNLCRNFAVPFSPKRKILSVPKAYDAQQIGG